MGAAVSALFTKERPKFTINVIVAIICVFQSAMLFTDFSTGDFLNFFRSGMPNPSVCGPLLLIWTILCVLYIAGTIKSPKISTFFAAVCVYFGTATLLFFRPEMMGGGTLIFIWATSVHALEAYIGYVYFIESAIRKYKLW